MIIINKNIVQQMNDKDWVLRRDNKIDTINLKRTLVIEIKDGRIS